MKRNCFGVNNIFLNSILLIMVLMSISLTINIEFGHAEWEFREDIGAGIELCENVRARLNSYVWKSIDDRFSCTWNVVASYSEFKEPPWENLDPAKHEELIFKLMKYRLTPYGGDKAIYGDEGIRKDVKEFIKNGGILQVWRACILMPSVDGPVPPCPQTIVQLRYHRDIKQEKERCPGKPVVDWWGGGLYLVKEDLSGPYEMRNPWLKYFTSLAPFLISGKLYFVGRGDAVRIDYYYDGGSAPGILCDIRYKSEKGRE
jgi:hypothetical protein